MMGTNDESQLRMILESYLEPGKVEDCVRQLLSLSALTPRTRAAIDRVEQLRKEDLNASTELIVIAALSGAAEYDRSGAAWKDNQREAAEFDEWAGGLPSPPLGLLGMIYRELGFLAQICRRVQGETPLTAPEKTDIRRHGKSANELRATLEDYIIPPGAMQQRTNDRE
jgi:hypothetical protein